MPTDEMIADALKALKFLAIRRGGHWGTVDELFSVAETAFALKLNEWDSEKSPSLRAWACTLGNWAITDYLRSIDLESRRARRRIKSGAEVQQKHTITDACLEWHPFWERPYDDFDMEALIDTLPARLAYVVRERFLRDRMQNEIAASMALTESRVSQMIQKALRLLKGRYHQAL